MNRELFLLAKKVMEEGGNVSQALRAQVPDARALSEIIAYSYDLQSGSYVALLDKPEVLAVKTLWGEEIAGILRSLNVRCALEAGVGEGTTLKFIAESLGSGCTFSGFDISLSRLLYAQAFFSGAGLVPDFFCADLMNIPLAQNSVDVILANHSIEPNGGREEQVLDELLRVTARYLVLVEPDYDLGCDQQKRRMEMHNYVRGLKTILERKPGKILRYEPWRHNLNPLNRASLLVFEKDAWTRSERKLVSPVSGGALERMEEFYFCPSDGFIFPVIHGIPCLMEDYAILGSHIREFSTPGASPAKARG